MQKSRAIFLYISIFILLPQSASRASGEKTKPVKKSSFMRRSTRRAHSYLKQYKGYVEGIECALCAQSAVDLIKGINGVIDVCYEIGKLGYEDGFLKISWDTTQGEIQEVAIKNILAKEEFVMQKFEAA